MNYFSHYSNFNGLFLFFGGHLLYFFSMFNLENQDDEANQTSYVFFAFNVD